MDLTKIRQFLPYIKSLGDGQADNKVGLFPSEMGMELFHWGSRTREFGGEL